MARIKVKDLMPNTPGINIIVRVIAKSEPRMVKTKYGLSRVCDLKVGDETGTVTLSLWGSKIKEANFGDLLEITDGYCREWQGRPQLSLGRSGVMTKIEDESFPDAKTLLGKFIEENIEDE